MRKICMILIFIILVTMCACSSSIKSDTKKSEDTKQSVIEGSETIKNNNALKLMKVSNINSDKVAMCLFEVDTWNIPKEELRDSPKPYSAYYIYNNVFHLIEKEDNLQLDDKMFCAFRINESRPIFKSLDSVLKISQTFRCQLNNEYSHVNISSLDNIALQLLEDESLEVKYAGKSKTILKNDTFKDEIPVMIDSKEFEIKISIKNYGLIDKIDIEDGKYTPVTWLCCFLLRSVIPFN